MSNKEKVKKENKTEITEEVSLLTFWNEQLDVLQEYTGIRGIYVVILILLSIIFVFFGYFNTIITMTIGTVYPVFCTIKSIENKTNDDKQWLSYWIVYGIFIVIDMFNAIIVKIIPFYFFFKIVFLLWCVMPNTGGAIVIYNLVIVRFFKKIEKNVETTADSIKRELNNIVKKNK